MRLTRIKGKKVPGFTLVEMAIVLVIIGIILAGIMKGRDIVRGSQVKQFSQGFAQKWVTIAATYYDKVGQQLCDGTDNGGVAAVNGGAVNGRMDGAFFGTGAIANGVAGVRDDLLQSLRDVGITPCTMIKSDLDDDTSATTFCGTVAGTNYNIYERTVDGEYTGKARVGVGFVAVQVGASGPVRNCVFLQNVPTDVAIGLDTMIDGQADGQNGSCICTDSKTDNQGDTDTYAEGETVTPRAYDSTTRSVGGTPHPTWVSLLLVLDY